MPRYLSTTLILATFYCVIGYAEDKQNTSTHTLPNNGYLAGPIEPERLKDLTAAWESPKTTVLGPFHNLYNPSIVQLPDAEFAYHMWFFGWAVADSNPTEDGRYLNDAIYYARSHNLTSGWEVYCGTDTDGTIIWDQTMTPKRWVPVMTYGKVYYDSEANGDPSVVYHEGTFYMAYSSVGFDRVLDEQGVIKHLYVTSCVMGATSKDGIHWTKTETPILIWNKESLNRWDIAWRNPAPPPDEYYGSYHRPSLMFDKGIWRLWFDYYHPGTFVCMGYAECTGDFMNSENWKVIHAGSDSLLKDWPNTSVIKINDEKYYAFSDAPGYPAEYGGDGRVLTMAESKDGLHWKMLGHLRPEGMEASHVPEAFISKESDGTWLYLFYAWKPESQPDKPWDYRYKEIRYMRKQLSEGEKQ